MKFKSKSQYESNWSFMLEKEPQLDIVFMFLKLDSYVEDFICTYKGLLVHIFRATQMTANAWNTICYSGVCPQRKFEYRQRNLDDNWIKWFIYQINYIFSKQILYGFC